ncbi:MAG: thioesterase II family protein [Cuspidothrix sp.]
MTRKTNFTSWVTCPQPNPEAKLRLFCFPFAGGSSTAFRTWPNYLPKTIEVCPIEIPGRGRQIKSPLYTEIQPLVQKIATNIIPYLDKPFAFFGYSMGALIGFELIRLLRSAYNFYPLYLFIAARGAPQSPNQNLPISQLPDADFLVEIAEFNGTPLAVLENTELMEIFLPIMRADFTLLESYIYRKEPPLDCPITAFGGLQDQSVSYNSLLAWQVETIADYSLQMIEGDHFFMNTAIITLLNSVSQYLQPYI